LSDTLLIILLFATGAAVGFLSVLLGVGGGIVFVPAIDYYLSSHGFSGHLLVTAILANSLATIAFTGAVGSVKQFRMGNYFPREIALTSAGGIGTSLTLSYLISTYPIYSKDMFNAFFATLLLLLVVRMVYHKHAEVKDTKAPVEWKEVYYLSVGALTGCVTALSGLGGGIIMVPILHQLMRLNLKVATSVSTGVITLLVLPVASYYALQPSPALTNQNQLMLGWLDVNVIVPLAIGSTLFAPWGVRTSHILPEGKTRMIFMIFSGAVFIKILREIWM